MWSLRTQLKGDLGALVVNPGASNVSTLTALPVCQAVFATPRMQNSSS